MTGVVVVVADAEITVTPSVAAMTVEDPPSVSSAARRATFLASAQWAATTNALTARRKVI